MQKKIIYKNENRFFKYGYPLVKLVNIYDLIPVELIIELVHVVPRYDKKNEYYINYFILLFFFYIIQTIY